MVILQELEKTYTICKNCNVSRFVTDETTGEIICSNCGCVISENTEE